MTDPAREIPTKPYFLRALYEWCVDNGYTPHLTVRVDEHCRVPRTHVKDGQITFNIGDLATQNLQLGNDYIAFQARFNGIAQQVSVPIGAVAALYARESGTGMGFETESAPPLAMADDTAAATTSSQTASAETTSTDGSTRPRFQIVK